jgi:hypothetical protein
VRNKVDDDLTHEMDMDEEATHEALVEKVRRAVQADMDEQCKEHGVKEQKVYLLSSR